MQRFLGFTNSYCGFVRAYSKIVSPLRKLTSVNVSFNWSSEADTEKTTTPVFIQPDPSKQFVVEVDASAMGVGAVLSQWSSPENRLQPCAFYSRRLTATISNYDVGNCELLVVKLALDDTCWRGRTTLCSLDRSQKPCLHPVSEEVTIRPGVHHLSPDSSLPSPTDPGPGTASLMPSPDSPRRTMGPSTPVAILPEEHVVEVLNWQVERVVKEAHRQHPDAGTCLRDRMFIPNPLRSQVLQWRHSSQFARHADIANKS